MSFLAPHKFFLILLQLSYIYRKVYDDIGFTHVTRMDEELSSSNSARDEVPGTSLYRNNFIG